MSGLDPSGEEGRDLLRRELLRPEYQQENPVVRLLDWITRRLDEGLAVARTLEPLVVAAAMVVLLALALAVAWLLARARTERRDRVAAGVLDAVVESAARLRERAEAALVRGEVEAALLDAFRALARRAVERGRLPDRPGATAREIADTLATGPDAGDGARGAALRRAAHLFDGVRYGDRRVDAADVAAVLELDDVLAGAR